MKTIREFVASLNDEYEHSYDRRPFSTAGSAEYDYLITYDSGSIVIFSKNDKTYTLCSYIYNVEDYYQHQIVKYLANADVDYWFSAKKYNIVIGEGECVGTVAAYCAMDDDVYVVDNRTEPEQLKDGAYQFTEEEIDNFKIKLSNKFAEIVDLGKVEVK